jgi:hypothetical protein
MNIGGAEIAFFACELGGTREAHEVTAKQMKAKPVSGAEYLRRDPSSTPTQRKGN